MSDDVTYEPGFGRTQEPREDSLRDAIEGLGDTIRDIARRTAALDARIDALPGPMEIASAVESEVEHSVREARDVIDARVGGLGVELESLSRRLAEVSDSLVPLEGLRTEIATVAGGLGVFGILHRKRSEIVATVQAIADHLDFLARIGFFFLAFGHQRADLFGCGVQERLRIIILL